jgi:hypothetical protein
MKTRLPLEHGNCIKMNRPILMLGGIFCLNDRYLMRAFALVIIEADYSRPFSCRYREGRQRD